jgi:uncharacterized phage protein gp47/JayE
MSCSGAPNCTCGCCLGTSVQTPVVANNPPGLAAISYRAGTWAAFKESMLARLSSSDYPALSSLKTRDDDDFTIAFLDATAVVLDILTFYQERLANESYLRTAGQLRSLTELSRLIGYQPSPGVAATTVLAFTLQTSPGQPPNPSTPPITIPKGMQVQSVPAQGKNPQTFETSADILAKPDWNALQVQTGTPWTPSGNTELYLSGTSTQLQQGDSLLILGVARENWDPSGTIPVSEQWDVVVLKKVVVDNVRKATHVTWDQPLTHKSGGTSAPPYQWPAAVFAFRQKAALFGHNAPSPNLFASAKDPTKTSLPDLIDDGTELQVLSLQSLGQSPQLVIGQFQPISWSWWNFTIPSNTQIDLDATYPKIVVDSWFALTMAGGAQLYKVKQAKAVSVANFALSAKVTELTPDYLDPKIESFDLRTTEVWAQSDRLVVAEQPLNYPLYGDVLDLKDLRPDLTGVQAVALFGKRQKLTVADGVTGLTFVPDAFGPDDNPDPMPLNPGDLLTLTDPAPFLSKTTNGSIPDRNSLTSQLTLNVEDASGRPGTVQAHLSNFTLALAAANDPQVSEYALVATVSNETLPYPHTQIKLQNNLLNCYERTTTMVNANVGLATQGQSVSEIMGNGNASTPNQEFTLKQYPLTFTQASTPTGRQSSLSVKVNGITRTEEQSLYNQGPSEQVYSTLNQPDGHCDVLFGDGVEGALLPTGQNNIQATYRIGLGLAGNVGANTITTLVDRPLGVSGVTNPAAATGGQDPDSVAQLRTSVPQTVLTLGRAVSITDYQNYASSFAGIAKAHAIWIPNGVGQGIFLTVAAAGGAALPPGNSTLTSLVTSLQNYGNPLIPITVVTFLETLFSFSADLQYDQAYDAPTVKNQVLAALYAEYSFDARTFGQGVSADELATTIQSVPGVVAVNVTGLRLVATSSAGDLANLPGGITVSNFKNWLAGQVTDLVRPFSDSSSRICPYLPVANTQSLPNGAEILVLDPNPNNLVLGIMS